MDTIRIYMIPYNNGDTTSAWQKAPSDVLSFASRYFKVSCLKPFISEETFGKRRSLIISRVFYVFRRLFFCIKCYLPCSFGIEHGSLLLLQHPYNGVARGRGEPMLSFAFLRRMLHRRGATLGFLIHDVDELRMQQDRNVKAAAMRLNALIANADYIIVHNVSMLDWFVKRGVPIKKLVNLQIFDYDSAYEPTCVRPRECAITIAGALNPEKAAYLTHLSEISNVDWHLYGKGFDKEKIKGENIHYHGVFQSDEIPVQLKYGFGLVWDGDTVDSCTGISGEYLRYNNPHKLSLYLASGLPVVIWKEAAEARFVRDNGVGIVVGSLREVKDAILRLSEQEYEIMQNNVLAISQKLRNGFYTRQAIETILKRMGDERIQG